VSETGLGEAARVYARFKEVFGGRTSSYTARMAAKERAAKAEDDGGSAAAFGPGRDPVTMRAALTSFLRDFGFEAPLAQADLMSAWADIAGPETAAHSTPLHIDDGVLVIQCDSTAWATQLRSMKSMILATIEEKYRDAGVESVQFLNPGAPSWKRGPRSVPGRGPRDTYG